MDDTTKYKLVNWTDGMRINRNHFIASDNYHIQQSNLSRHLYLNENSFGMLPVDAEHGLFPDFEVVMSNGQVIISRFALSLVMLNGSFFMMKSDEINDNVVDSFSLNLKFKIDPEHNREYAVMIRTRPYERIDFGAYDSEEAPLNRPKAIQGFAFSVEPVKQAQKAWIGKNFFVIAKFEIEDSLLRMDKDFIPPATCMLSHPALKDIQSSIYNDVLMLETFITKASSKYRTKRSNDMNETLLYIASNMLMCISRIKFELKHKTLYQPPVYLVCLIKELANIISQSLDVRSNVGKDSFLGEIIKILGMSKKDFNEQLNKLINLEYRHFDIRSAFDELAKFLDDMKALFGSLSEYDKARKNTILTIKK